MNVLEINTNSTAMLIVGMAMRRTKSLDFNKLCPCICEILETMFNKNEIDDKLEEIRMSTTKEIDIAINSYIKTCLTKKVTGTTNLSREVRNIFNKAISNINTTNKEALYLESLRILKEKYPKESLEYKTVKLGLSSKEQAFDLLSLYFYNTEDNKKNYRNVCSFLF